MGKFVCRHPTVDETGRETKQIWTTDFETYISDHFMFRDQWVGLKSLVELGAQKKDSGGVYFAKRRIFNRTILVL